ncbi:hypothetical protein [Infirmifilum sp. SLHALR2]
MPLETPPEPVEVKTRINELFRALSRDLGPHAAGVAVWSGNLFARHLWGSWGSELRRLGFTWPRFLAFLKPYTPLIARWAIEGSMRWEDLVEKIRADLESSRGWGLERFLA